jgi:hypothetical protein
MTDNLRNPELEQALLGAILIDPGALVDVTPIVQPQDFSILRNAAIFQAAIDITSRGATPDYLTITEVLKSSGDGADESYITGLFAEPSTSLNALEYAHGVKDLATRRRLVADHLEKANYYKNRDNPLPDETQADGAGWTDPWAGAWHTLADAFTPRPPQEWAVEDLIKLPSLNAFYGSPGDLKTMFLMDMALCIAAGHPFLLDAPWQSGGRTFAVNPYPVIWLDFDNGDEMTNERFEALARARDIDPALPNLHYISMPSPWLVLGDPKSIGHLTRQIENFGARAVYIDNLGTTKGGAKENTDEMIPVMSNLRQLVNQTKTATSFIHHETKNGALTARRGDSLRGHSSIEASIDLALLVEREPGSDIITIQSTKTRGVDVAPFSAVWTFEHKAGTTELETAIFYGLPCENKKSPKAIETAIRESLADGPMLKTKLTKKVHEQTEGIGVNRIRDYIDRMINADEIVTTPGGRTDSKLCALA